MVEGTVVEGIALPQQPYAQQAMQPMAVVQQPMAVVQAPYGQPMAVPQATYGGATVVPYVPQATVATQAPTNDAIQRGPANQTFPARWPRTRGRASWSRARSAARVQCASTR